MLTHHDADRHSNLRVSAGPGAAQPARVGAIALSLLGVTPKRSIVPLSRFYPIHWYCVVVIFFSGVALLMAYPAKALTNPVFYLKLVALIIGLLISRYLQKTLSGGSETLDLDRKIKMLGGLSIFLWVVTISAGRFLAYTNSVLLASRFF